jgi:AmmeMemoRadiSam system protein B
LRPYLKEATSASNPQSLYLVDQLGLAKPFALSHTESGWLDWLDGRYSVADLQRKIGMPVSQWLTRLDQAMCLDSPRFRDVVNAHIRPPRCIGCYEGAPDALRLQLRRLFEHPRGAGLPRPTTPDGSLRAALIPHIDYARGGLSYTHAFKEIVEKSDALLFVVIGTSHYSSHRFTLTRKHFQTPLGVATTDQDYIDRLVREFGNGLFDDEWLAHFPEHSIELEVVFLQYLYENVRRIRIVPLVVGSFHDCVLDRQVPRLRADIANLVQALRNVEEKTKEPICYIISGDLAHIGPKFNDHEELTDRLLERSFHQDQALLRHAAAVDLDGYFRVIAAERDVRNICGLPPTWATLDAIRPRLGKTLCYDRYIDPDGHESVSFASMAFYR